MANATQCVVLSVDYRLAPEHPFPVQLEDFYSALCWIGDQAGALGLDRLRIGVAGDSAGGNLAAAALMARDRAGPPIAHQLLLYPALDCDFSTSSYQAFAEGYWLTRQTMEFCWSTYLADKAHAAAPYASPLRAPSLRDLPPATILVSEYDPLRDEGEAYALRLREAGVEVSYAQLERMVHGCIHMLGLTPHARQLFSLAGAAVAGLV